MLTRAGKKCNVAYSCTFHFCSLSKYIELSLLLAPFPHLFLLSAGLYLRKKERERLGHIQAEQAALTAPPTPQRSLSLTLVSNLPRDSGAESGGYGARLLMFILWPAYLASQLPSL